MRCDAIRISVYSGKVCIRAGKSLLAGSVLFIRPGPPRSIHEAGARRTAVTSDTAPPRVAMAQPWRRPTLTPVLRRASLPAAAAGQACGRAIVLPPCRQARELQDRKRTRLNASHLVISYAG